VCVAVAILWRWLDDSHRLLAGRDAADDKKQELDADNRRLSAIVALAEACSRSSGTPEIAKRAHATYMKHPFDAQPYAVLVHTRARTTGAAGGASG
jgi:hypothetical protein